MNRVPMQFFRPSMQVHPHQRCALRFFQPQRTELRILFGATVRSTVGIRAGFSLMEMLVAIVILGLGMIMIGTMFPVAWTRARDLSEATNLRAVVENAHATLKSSASSDGSRSDSCTFAGTLLFARPVDYPLDSLPDPGQIFNFADTRVHSLNMENVRVSPRAIQNEDPFDLERIDTNVPMIDWPYDLSIQSFGTARLKLESRVHPPLRPRASRNLTASDDPEWDAMFANRRYPISILHRARNIVGPLRWEWPTRLPAGLVLAEQSAGARRDLDVYYVMLRRPQPTLRYARQNPSSAPNPYSDASPIAPAALPASNDVLLPVPWRVQLYFRGPFAGEVLPAGGLRPVTSLPSEVEVNPPEARTDALAVDLFPTGARFVDELSGLMFRVTKRRYGLDDPTRAVLTLDREIQLTDLEWPVNTQTDYPCGACQPDVLDDDEKLRTVWVFPPPVMSQRSSTGKPLFEGAQPVVGIEVRTLTLIPDR